jgi:hypothetical protein
MGLVGYQVDADRVVVLRAARQAGAWGPGGHARVVMWWWALVRFIWVVVRRAWL